MSGCLCFTSIPLLTDDHYRPNDGILKNLTAFEFSNDQVLHYFCTSCGTHMLAHVLPRERDNHQGRWFAACGAIENVAGVYHPCHEYIADTLDGGFADLLVSLNDIVIERWAQYPQESEQLPRYWRSTATPRTESSPTDWIHAYCKCKGVEFWIARPDSGAKYAALLCACTSCRLAVGMEWPVGVMATIPITQISPDKAGRSSFQQSLTFGTLRTYHTSPDVRWSFCSVCGAFAFRYKDGSEAVDLGIGLLDGSGGARMESWLEWDTGAIGFREDGIARDKHLLLAVEHGLREYQALLDERHKGKVLIAIQLYVTDHLQSPSLGK